MDRVAAAADGKLVAGVSHTTDGLPHISVVLRRTMIDGRRSTPPEKTTRMSS
jgi:hypothetical protein